jgi:hypothetical protein
MPSEDLVCSAFARALKNGWEVASDPSPFTGRFVLKYYVHLVGPEI